MSSEQYANQFAMNQSNVSYLKTDDLGPYFRRVFAKNIKQYISPVAVKNEEMDNVQNKQQCGFFGSILEWTKREISVLFIKSLIFFGMLKDAKLKTLSETDYDMPFQHLIALGVMTLIFVVEKRHR